jgi:hypothetical protein
MKEISPVGQFFKKDTQNNIINPCSYNSIHQHWLLAIELVKASYLIHLKDKTHSIYLRGSVPRGLSVDNISDLDSFALIHQANFGWDKATWYDQLNVLIKKKYPFIAETEVMLSSYHENLFKVNPKLSMILKTQSLCIYGEDIIPSIPNFKPDRQMMLNYFWLEKDLTVFYRKSTIKKEDCRKIMKLILRTGFELTMERNHEFTTDLYLCYKTFCQYYPSKNKEMKQVLLLYLNPSHEAFFLKNFLNNFGNWMISEVRKQIG